MVSPRHLLALILPALLLAGYSLTAQTIDRPARIDDPVRERDTTAFVPLLEYVEESNQTSVGHSALSSTAGTQIASLARTGTTGFNYCNNLAIHSGAIRVTLDLGDDYNYGTTAFTVDVSLKVQGYDVGTSSVLLTHDPVDLIITQDAPEQTFYIPYTGTDLTNHNLVDAYLLVVNSYSVTGSVTGAVRVTMRYDDQFAVNAIRPSPDQALSIAELLPFASGNPVSYNPLMFQWQLDDGCNDRFPAWQIQILRLYNRSDDYENDPTQVNAFVDWNEALTVEVPDVDDWLKAATLTIPQGTGWYLWRVRPIGSVYPGESADSRNWGVWTDAPATGDVVDYDGFTDPDIEDYAFYYEQFEDTLTWVYSRSFSEGEGGSGSRIAEGIGFVSPLGRPVQTQIRSAEEGHYLVHNTVADFQGRGTLGAMSGPTGNSSEGFKFRRDFFNVNSTDPYTAEDFDDDANWNNPAQVYETTGSVSKYYNGSTVESGSLVPDAENYPFSRVLLSTDGSGRPREISGAGETYRLGGGAGGQSRTAKIYYASASDQELVRLFGDEAPADTNVAKMLITGPNKVTTVQWMSEGRVIATAWQTAVGDTLLVDWDDPTESVLSALIVDTLRGNRSSGTLGSTAHKRYAFTDTTDIDIYYSLKRSTIATEGLCVDTCATCDYRIRLYVHNVDLKDSTKIFEYKLGADPCGEGEDIEETITVTLPPGTYIIERRLEIGTIDSTTIDAENPYGRTYADQFRDLVARINRDSILADDSLSIIMDFLDEGDLEGLYEYLGLNLNALETYEAVTITTSCCEVTFPILNPDCGFDPCRDSVPGFENYLFEKWGDEYGTDLNTYFKFDGDQNIWPGGGGAHPFDSLVANMLVDTNESGGPLYECKTLFGIWAGMVNGWEQLKRDPDDPENPAGFNPDFNMLDMFLQAAGVYWTDTSHTPYDPANGYLRWAHRYVNHNVLDADCQAWTGYNSGWHGDADSTRKWVEIYNCRNGRNRNNRNSRLDDVGPDCDLSPFIPGWGSMSQAQKDDSCRVYTARRAEESCRTTCENRRMEFALGIMQAYEEAEDPITLTEALCKADELVNTCLGDCELTVFPDSIGTPAEWEAIRRVHTDVLEIRKADEDIYGTKFCLNDSLTLYEGYEIRYEELIERRLNLALDRYRAEYGGGLWAGFMDTLRAIAPDSIVSLVTDSLVWIPSSLSAGAYFEIRDSCELWYVADTIFHDGGSHPLVLALNRFLDSYWGMEVDSSVTPNVISGAFNGGQVRVREYDWETNAADIVAAFLNDSVRCINGELALQPIDSYITFASQYERALFYDNERFGRITGMFHMNLGGGSNDEVVIQSAYSSAWDVYDILHLAASDSSGAGTYRAYRAAGAAANPALNQDAGKTYIIGSFDELSDFLDEPYTLRIGRFDIDDEGYLVYYDRKFDPAADPDTFRIFHIRFFGLPTRKLSDDACGLMRCPDICWRWVKRPDPDWSNVDTIAPPPCRETALLRIRSAINKSIDECIDEDLHNLKQQYELSCGDPKNLDEVITVQYPVDYIHFSLYYYDRAGRLVRTVPPKGVDVLGPTATRMDSPDHTYVTEYRYNSLGQLVQTESPDGGMSRYWYDRVGRLRFSQDARLAARGEYAYTKFDDIGRVVEFGVSDDSASFTAFAGSHNVEDPDFPPTGSERTYLAYDSVPSVITYLDGKKQTFLRNRVRKVWTDDTVVTHFSYDVHGNIVWTAQEIPGFPRKNYTKYEYDLISGNVNQVLYNEGRVDEFRHRYTYDADNALVRVETSHDGVIWDTDARYEYYSHGRLRRAEIGEDKLQGLDYTWTIDGRLKAINHPALQFGADPGKDGKSHHGHQAFAADSFAVMLHYHGDDFIAAGSTPFNSGGSDDLAPVPQYDGNIAGMETHVGRKAGGTQKYEERTGESYRYDPLGRLDSSRFHTWNNGSGSWNAHGQEYLTTYEYDANGNITKLIRHSYTQSGSTEMDSLTYHYKAGQTNRIDYVFDAVAGDPHSEDLENTQSAGNYEYDPVGNLTQDNDEGGMTVEWSAYGKVKEIDRDIPMPSPVAAEEITYTYDAGGNRVRKRVQTSTGTGGVEIDETFYVHDAGGVVVAIYEKYCDDDLVVPPPPGGGPDSDFDGWPDVTDNCKTTPNPDQRDSDGDGVGDACDNCTCTPNPDQIDANMNTRGDACEADHPTDPDGDSYPADHDNCPCSFNPNQEDTDGDGYGDSCDVCAVHLVELPIYGLGRLGVSKPDIDIDNELPPDDTFTRRLNEKHYELADHLGNVRAVLGDRKLTATPGAGNYYGDIRSYSHPYPFGMPQPGRNWDRSGDTLYRYGYNGMETDGEVKEERGNHYTTYFRQYDPRLGRWWSTDPVVQPGESPYAAMYNNPILFSDPLGNDPEGDNPLDPGGGVSQHGGGGGSGTGGGGPPAPHPFVLTGLPDQSRTDRPVPLRPPPPAPGPGSTAGKAAGKAAPGAGSSSTGGRRKSYTGTRRTATRPTSPVVQPVNLPAHARTDHPVAVALPPAPAPTIPVSWPAAPAPLGVMPEVEVQTLGPENLRPRTIHAIGKKADEFVHAPSTAVERKYGGLSYTFGRKIVLAAVYEEADRWSTNAASFFTPEDRPVYRLNGQSLVSGERKEAKLSFGLDVMSLFLPNPSRAVRAPQSESFVYRALSSDDLMRIQNGEGLIAKAPHGEWSAVEHVANSSDVLPVGGASANSPWISTTRRFEVAEWFNATGGNGIAVIDLTKVPSLQVEVWRVAPRTNGRAGVPFHRSFWSEEITIYKEIPLEAIIKIFRAF